MLKKIFRATSFAIVSVVLICSILFTGWSSAQAIPNVDNEDSSLTSMTKQSAESQNSNNEEISKEDMNMRELFGDDQVFPFAAGLDSY